MGLNCLKIPLCGVIAIDLMEFIPINM